MLPKIDYVSDNKLSDDIQIIMLVICIKLPKIRSFHNNNFFFNYNSDQNDKKVFTMND